MPLSTTQRPRTDPTPIFEFHRGAHATELLAAAIAHLNVFTQLAGGPLSFDELRGRLNLAERPANVLFTALRAMGLLHRDSGGKLALTPIAREHLLAGSPFDVSDYVGLVANNPGVLEMVERLRTNRPAGAKPGGAGAAFIYREGIESAMESEASARSLTLALAGRAKNVAPAVAERLSMEGVNTVLDVGGGTGIYSIALLQRHPGLRAIIFDRTEVLKVAAEMGAAYGVSDRLELLAGDMFTDDLPAGCQVVLLSNVLHDWDVPQCQALVNRCAAILPASGRVVVHDVFLDDDLGGPLAVALYSSSLFSLTEGRAYSAQEYRQMLRSAGLTPQEEVVPTLIHCGLLAGGK
ncbi:MAG TPA: methyltransferase [Tepidisphaeraceae bacterium]|jgi:predicted O-methyltransferase YrrM